MDYWNWIGNNMQKDYFLNGGGDQWFARNANNSEKFKERYDEFLIGSMDKLPFKPLRVLEIGCSAGWWLNAIRGHYDAYCYGIDPSVKAIEYGKMQYPELVLQQGTADNLPFKDDFFDVVVFGFCLYLCDPKDLFKIASEADRVLKSPGALFIIDFDTLIPHYNIYAHHEGIKCYKMDFSKMFYWHPGYNLTYKECVVKNTSNVDARETISVLLKNFERAFIKNPFIASTIC